MIVCIVCDVLGAKNNGTTMAATNLIDYLTGQGHEVRVVCCDKDKKGKENYYVTPTLNLGKFCNKILEENGVSLAKTDDKILTEAIKGSDVVHILIPFGLARKAIRIANEYNLPITASFHCQAENITAHVFLMNVGFVNKLIYKNFYKHVYRYCDYVHYPTEFIKNIFELATEKTDGVVISNGVNENFFKGGEAKRVSDKFTIVCTGRYSREKAQELLIKAIPLTKHKDDIKVVFAGTGPCENKLKKLAAKYDVDAEFRFFSREDLMSMLRGADLYVHTAKIEIEAISCLEAIVSGLVPVINDSPRSATRAFALDENNLFKKDDIKDLAEKIDFWFENPDIKNEYKERYKSMVGAFDQKECMRNMEKMLYAAIEKKKKEVYEKSPETSGKKS